MKTLIFVVLALFCGHNLFAQDSMAEKSNSYRLLWTEMYSAGDETHLLAWWLRFNPNGFVWDVVGSTEGWTQGDIGYGVINKNKTLSMIGMLGTSAPFNPTRLENIIPQFYAVYWNEKTRTRFQSWNMTTLSITKLSRIESFRIRNFVTYKGIGTDLDYSWREDAGVAINVGPMLELNFNPGILLLEPLYNFDQKSWSFKIVYFLEWL